MNNFIETVNDFKHGILIIGVDNDTVECNPKHLLAFLNGNNLTVHHNIQHLDAPPRIFTLNDVERDKIKTAFQRGYDCGFKMFFKGVWINSDELPAPGYFKVTDVITTLEEIYVLNNNNVWQEMLEQLPAVTAVVEPEEPTDVGAIARELMERKAEVKRLKRKRIIDRIVFWLIALSCLVVAGVVGWKVLVANYEEGRYYDTRECKVSSANLTVNGKRTYSYPFKSLFGFRLVDENNVKEKTTLTLNGTPMTIVGTSNDRWWGIRLAQGDRNVQILRDADMYTFTTDKGIAVTTYKGFCQQREQSVEMDPKTKDFPIVN